MAKLSVLAQLRVMPTGIEVDLKDLIERIRSSLPENTKIEAYREEDIAFGLKALVINLLMEDKAGGTQPVETAISSLEGVETVEVVGVTKI
mgnify:CR=1 FL=1